MSKKKPPVLLLTDDISLDQGRERRSDAVKMCADKLARRLSASIDLVHVEDLFLYPVRTPQFKPLIDQYFKAQKAKLEAVTSSLDVPTRALFLNGEPVKKIISVSSRRGAYELIVQGTHGRTGLLRLILGSVAEEIVRRARIPTMTVGPKAQERSSEFLCARKITLLIPTGLTPNSTRAEDYGVALARRLGADVVFFHSLHEALHPVLQTAFSVPNPSPAILAFFEEVKTDSRKLLSKRVEKALKKGVPASFQLDDTTVSSSDAVLKEASRVSASLIIMGTHGRSKVSAAFFGRTARDVILGAAVPVVTVHSTKS
jgi:nucleotide-binding universal stress UspA family protein